MSERIVSYFWLEWGQTAFWGTCGWLVGDSERAILNNQPKTGQNWRTMFGVNASAANWSVPKLVHV